MNPETAKQVLLSKRQRRVLGPKNVATQHKIYPAQDFGSYVPANCGEENLLQAANKENIPPLWCVKTRQASLEKKLFLLQEKQEGRTLREPLVELSREEINARSTHLSDEPEPTQETVFEGLGEGEFHPVLSARSMARLPTPRPRRKKFVDFQIFEDL